MGGESVQSEYMKDEGLGPVGGTSRAEMGRRPTESQDLRSFSRRDATPTRILYAKLNSLIFFQKLLSFYR